MQGFRSYHLFLFCIFLSAAPALAQEEVRTWVLTGFPKAQFKGKVVAKLDIWDRTRAYLFETENESFVLDNLSFDSKTQDELAAMELPIAEPKIVYETAWKQLDGDALSPWRKHMVDGAEEAFEFLIREKEDGYVAPLGQRMLDLSEGENGIKVNTNRVQREAASAFASMGDIAKAKAIVSKIPEERVSISMWESMFDFEKVADLSIAEMERSYERFQENGGRFPLSNFESAIRRNIRIGRVERVAGIADLWLSESIKDRPPGRGRK